MADWDDDDCWDESFESAISRLETEGLKARRCQTQMAQPSARRQTN